MKPDMIVGWEQHLKNGNVWVVEVELAMQDGDSDIQRIYDIIRLINEGYNNQILLGQDLFFKCSLVAYGGFGYAHIIENLIPFMKAKGMTEQQIHTLLVENPGRFLQFVPV